MRSTGMISRGALNPPSLTPPDEVPGSGSDMVPGTGTEYGDPEIFATGPDGVRTTQLPLAPGAFQEMRVMLANRAGFSYTPSASYDNQDPQKGGAPGAPGGADGFPDATNFITSQGPDGVTTAGGVPPSPIKLAYGWSDYSGHMPTFVGAHLKIQWNANPNKPQLNVTPFNTEGPMESTQYSTPSPFAAGVFLG
jgi:hypothetical protein